MKEDRQACLSAGMDDYISKPIQVNELIEALHRCPTPERQKIPGAVKKEMAEIQFAQLNPALITRMESILGKELTGLNALLQTFLDNAPRLIQ